MVEVITILSNFSLFHSLNLSLSYTLLHRVEYTCSHFFTYICITYIPWCLYLLFPNEWTNEQFYFLSDDLLWDGLCHRGNNKIVSLFLSLERKKIFLSHLFHKKVCCSEMLFFSFSLISRSLLFLHLFHIVFIAILGVPVLNEIQTLKLIV